MPEAGDERSNLERKPRWLIESPHRLPALPEGVRITDALLSRMDTKSFEAMDDLGKPLDSFTWETMKKVEPEQRGRLYEQLRAGDWMHDEARRNDEKKSFLQYLRGEIQAVKASAGSSLEGKPEKPEDRPSKQEPEAAQSAFEQQLLAWQDEENKVYRDYEQAEFENLDEARYGRYTKDATIKIVRENRRLDKEALYKDFEDKMYGTAPASDASERARVEEDPARRAVGVEMGGTASASAPAPGEPESKPESKPELLDFRSPAKKKRADAMAKDLLGPECKAGRHRSGVFNFKDSTYNLKIENTEDSVKVTVQPRSTLAGWKACGAQEKGKYANMDLLGKAVQHHCETVKDSGKAADVLEIKSFTGRGLTGTYQVKPGSYDYKKRLEALQKEVGNPPQLMSPKDFKQHKMEQVANDPDKKKGQKSSVTLASPGRRGH
jgi:hypothetical protein